MMQTESIDFEQALKAAAQRPTPYKMKWADIDAYGHIFPEHQQKAQDLIDEYLGYEPHTAFYMPAEIHIREAIECLRVQEAYSQAHFEEDITRLVMHIRNVDMINQGWDQILACGEKELDQYNFKLTPFIRGARDRLARFLGYYPDIHSSFPAEIYLREFLSRDYFNPNWPLTACDYKAMTVVKYREALLTKGREAADNSPLSGSRFA